jgi:sugar/nucleoside kinase (ribokinase family)
MTTGTPLVVCCGLVTLDVLQDVERVPGPDEKVVATGLDVTFGGPAANAAATAVALGVRARLVTALGSGAVAALVAHGLDSAGVEVVDLLGGAPASPAVSTVLVTASTGERAVVSVNATGASDVAAAARERADAALAGADVLLVDGHHLGAALVLAARARSLGIPVVLDGGSWKPGLAELLAHVDHAVLSADFRLPDDPGAQGRSGPRGEPVPVPDLARVAALGPSVVARSAGSGPVRYRTPDGAGSVHPPVVPAGELVDTLGAGDVLHGAYTARLAHGDAPVAALRAAVEVASRSVRARGARGWVVGEHAGP